MLKVHRAEGGSCYWELHRKMAWPTREWLAEKVPLKLRRIRGR